MKVIDCRNKNFKEFRSLTKDLPFPQPISRDTYYFITNKIAARLIKDIRKEMKNHRNWPFTPVAFIIYNYGVSLRAKL